MVRFNCDYSEGAHPKIMQRLMETNLEQTAGYGEDPHCIRAADLIKTQCGRQDVDVHFLVGGTQTNLTLISASLRPHQGAIAADAAHIATHESGAIEATGHKVITLTNADGKITAQQIQRVYEEHKGDVNHEHIVQPGLVFLSQATECGAVYSLAELTAISDVCRQCGLLLYIDGARIGVALCAQGNDLDLAAIARLCDAFYIGGTKNGFLFGEALVIVNPEIKRDFRYIIKQKGGMLAKGRLLGVQFEAAFEDGLYFQMAKHANAMAELIRQACVTGGYGFLSDSKTNQQFPIMPDNALEKLGKDYAFSYWQRVDEKTSCVRFCTSWATRIEDVERLAKDIIRTSI
jgi:threonine aldolase